MPDDLLPDETERTVTRTEVDSDFIEPGPDSRAESERRPQPRVGNENAVYRYFHTPGF